MTACLLSTFHKIACGAQSVVYVGRIADTGIDTIVLSMIVLSQGLLHSEDVN